MRTAPLTLLVSALATASVAAESSPWDRFQIHGFASLALVTTSANNYYGQGDTLSPDFTELGLNLSYKLDPRILLSAQVLGRRAGDMYDGSPSLDYALADLSLLSGTEVSLGLALGRIKNPLGLYNETRDVPFTRPGIFLPQTVYYDRVRNLLLSSDGALLRGAWFNPWGNLSLAVGGGQAVVDDNVEWAYLGADLPGDIEPDGVTWIGSLWYATPDDGIKAGLSGASGRLRHDLGGLLGPDGGEIDYLYWVASLQYNSEDLTLSAEFSRVPTEYKGLSAFLPFEDHTSEGYYLQAAYRIRPRVELMARYEEGFLDRRDRDGRKLSALTGGQLPAYALYSKIATLGVRWDPTPNVMLRAEYQHHNGTLATSIRENPDPSFLRQHWDAFALSVSVRF